MIDTTRKPSRREVLKNASQYIVAFGLGVLIIPLSRFLNRLPQKEQALRFKKDILSKGLTVLPNIFVLSRGGKVKAFSRRCPHLGCTVQKEQQTGKLVCPCHGSRFTMDGKYISGPAKKNLRRLAISPLNEREWEVRS